MNRQRERIIEIDIIQSQGFQVRRFNLGSYAQDVDGTVIHKTADSVPSIPLVKASTLTMLLIIERIMTQLRLAGRIEEVATTPPQPAFTEQNIVKFAGSDAAMRN